MERAEFNDVVTFLQGAYNRTFPEAAVTVAWGMFRDYPAPIVQQAAVRMVESAEEFPNPMKWLRHVRTIQREAREDQTVRRTQAEIDEQLQRPRLPFIRSKSVARPRETGETDEDRIVYLRALIGTEGEDAKATAPDCLEYIKLLLARSYPPGHILSGIAVAGVIDPEPEYPDP